MTSYKILLDTMLPGDDTWPVASEALADWTPGPAFEKACALLARDLADTHPADRERRLRGAFDSHADDMIALQRAVYEAYYTAPTVHAVVDRLAASGPQDPAPVFDPERVRNVVREGRARMRVVPR